MHAVKVWAIRPSGASCDDDGDGLAAEGCFHGFENCGREPDEVDWVAMFIEGGIWVPTVGQPLILDRASPNDLDIT